MREVERKQKTRERKRHTKKGKGWMQWRVFDEILYDEWSISQEGFGEKVKRYKLESEILGGLKQVIENRTSQSQVEIPILKRES